MVNTWNNEAKVSEESIKMVQVGIDQIPKIINLGIQLRVSSKMRQFFIRFDLNYGFLTTDPSHGQGNEDFINALQLVNELKVVHDTAVRGIKLKGDYNKLLTKKNVFV